jgi:hypothetical protein
MPAFIMSSCVSGGGRLATAASVAIIFCTSCTKAASDRGAGAQPPPAARAVREAEPAAPHGGVLVTLGERFAYLEFRLDRTTGALTAYALDRDAHHPIRLTQPSIVLLLDAPAASAARALELVGVPNSVTGEIVGDSSEFTVTRPEFRGLAELRGRIIQVIVRGQEFRDVAFHYPGRRP